MRRQPLHLAAADYAKRDRKMLELYDNGIALTVIAERFGIARGSVFSAISRLRKKLTEPVK